MKKLIAPTLITLATLISSQTMATNAHAEHAGHGAAHSEAPLAALIDGQVKKVDKAGGKVTVSHGPLPNGMPAMTMSVKVKEATWLDRMKNGQKIRFATENVDGAMTIVHLELPK